MKEKNKEIHSICKIYVNKFRKHNRFDQVGIYEGKKNQVTGKSRLRNTHRKDNAEAGQYLLLKAD